MLIKKMTKTGKKRSALNILKRYLSLEKNRKLLPAAVLKLLFLSNKKNAAHNIPLHYYFSLSQVIQQLLFNVKKRGKSKMPFFKSLYLESCDVLKQ